MKIEKIIEILFILFFIISLLINLAIHTHLADPCISISKECNFTNVLLVLFGLLFSFGYIMLVYGFYPCGTLF